MRGADHGTPSASCRALMSCLLMNMPGHRLHVLSRSRRQDSMAEVENVSRPPLSAREHVVGRRQRAIERAEQERRIQVALNGPVKAVPLPPLVGGRPPVGADHAAARLAQFAENGAGPDTEVDGRYV